MATVVSARYRLRAAGALGAAALAGGLAWLAARPGNPPIPEEPPASAANLTVRSCCAG